MIISVIVVVVALVMLSVLFPDLMKTAVAERQSKNDVVVTLSSAPQITMSKTGSGYVYDIKTVLGGEYNGDYHEGAAVRMDVEAFVTFKGQTLRVTIEGKNYFSIAKNSEGKSEFSIEATAKIISDEPPMHAVTNPYTGEIKQRETLIIGPVALKLEKTGKRLFDKIPVVGGDICLASFVARCGKDVKSAELRECGEEYECKRELSMCGGSLDISINGIECGKGAIVTAVVKSTVAAEYGEEIYISFWEKTVEPSCADHARSYNELATTCYGDFLGEYTIDIGLLGDNA